MASAFSSGHFSVSTFDESKWAEWDALNIKNQEILREFVEKSRNQLWLKSNCVFRIRDAGEPEYGCVRVSNEKLKQIMMEAVHLLSSGRMKLNGETNNWSVGNMGSVWCDMDAKKFGVTYIRIAFYSKSSYPGTWKFPKPYIVDISVEKVSA